MKAPGVKVAEMVSMSRRAPLVVLVCLGILGSSAVAQGELRFCLRAEPKTFDPMKVEDEASVTVRPTKTGISCGLRRIRQLLMTDTAHLENYSDMLRVSLGQDLTVLGFDPFGAAWKLVLAYETDRNPAVSDSSGDESPSTKRRLMGGVSISF